MLLKKDENKTVLDGSDTLVVSKNDNMLTIEGFEDDPVEIENHYFLTKHFGKRKQLVATARWIYSDEIANTKKVATGTAIGIVTGFTLSCLARLVSSYSEQTPT